MKYWYKLQWVILENMLSEGRQKQKTVYCVISLIKMPQRGKCMGHRLLVARDWGDGESGSEVSFWGWSNILRGFPGCSVVKNPPANAGDVRDLGCIPELGRSLEEEMATHSSILAWRMLWTEEPGGLQSFGLQTVGDDWSNLARKYSAIR